MSNYTQLSTSERFKINAYLDKQSVREISIQLNRHRSTIYRELKRNKQNGFYDAGAANKLAKERRSGGAKSKFDQDPTLKKYVLEKLNLYWSPEEIAGRMRQEKQAFSVCSETIYQLVYRDPFKALYKLLPTQKHKRTHRHQRKRYHTAVKSAMIAARNIKNRPAEATHRNQIGHWEGDTIRFPRGQKHNATTLVDRASRFTILRKNLDAKTETVMNVICKTIKKSSKHLWKTLTLDQGSEFMGFGKIEKRTSCQTFFCDPHSPWQRPSNENTNGRIRRFLPKNFSIDSISQEDLDLISEVMNNTPRKCLGYFTPREVFMQLACCTSF